jgi:hypothetical protein
VEGMIVLLDKGKSNGKGLLIRTDGSKGRSNK